jgi:predicted metalloprotease with PDZ domain
MIQYQISCKNPASQYLQLTLTLILKDTEPVTLQLPAWRAGRYQLANYAQNIRGFRVHDENREPIPFEKTTKDRWVISPQTPGNLYISYEYWAGKMDAGSAWADEEQVFINLVNCCMEPMGKSEEEIRVILDLPDFPEKISTLLPGKGTFWTAKNFQMLADSTVLAAKNLTHWEYSAGATKFHIWIQGEVLFDEALFLDRFKSFSEKLIQDFGEFPEPDYHFIFQLPTYPHYHGVEHRRGTVITFGPAESLRDSGQMEELLGISCHELYHAWNVCRIRPSELLPYDFSKETYTKAGLVLEGVTTYMGDLYLLKSGVYDLETYLRHFEKIILRESANFGWENYTILESSFDLWLDGYVPGIPDRKVNIYTRGALIAICLDILLLKNGSSLAAIMKKMWANFGKPLIGYDFKDFEGIIVNSFVDQKEIKSFFVTYVYGYEDIFPAFGALLSDLGITLVEEYTENWLLHQAGIRTNPEGVILQIHPYSQAYKRLMYNDRILAWPLEKDSEEGEIPLHIDRNGRRIVLTLPKQNDSFFPLRRLFLNKSNPLTEKWKA